MKWGERDPGKHLHEHIADIWSYRVMARLFPNRLITELWGEYFGWYLFGLPGKIFWHYFAHRDSLFGRRRVDFDCIACQRWLTTGHMTGRKRLEMDRAMRVDPEFYQGQFASFEEGVHRYINKGSESLSPFAGQADSISKRKRPEA